MTVVEFPKHKIGPKKLCFETHIYEFKRYSPPMWMYVFPVTWVAVWCGNYARTKINSDTVRKHAYSS